jgi:hypothetical protein
VGRIISGSGKWRKPEAWVEIEGIIQTKKLNYYLDRQHFQKLD